MKHDTAYRPKHYKRQRPIQPQEMNTQSIIPLLITLLFLHPTTPLPSTPQSWASHKRALMQLQSDLAVGDGNSTATLKPTETTTPPLSTKPTEQQAESLLKLMLASLDHGDVRTIAMKLLPEYTKSCSTGIDCDELQSAMRRRRSPFRDQPPGRQAVPRADSGPFGQAQALSRRGDFRSG